MKKLKFYSLLLLSGTLTAITLYLTLVEGPYIWTFFLFLSFPLFILILLFYNKNIYKPFEEEKGKTAIINAEKCAGRIGDDDFYSLKITFYQDFISVTGNSRFLTYFKDIQEITPEIFYLKTLQYSGIKIQHHASDLPENIILGSTKVNEVIDLFMRFTQNQTA